MTPEQKTTQTRAAAHRSWARTPDRSRRTAPARTAAEARFEHEVDPDGVMPPRARAMAAESARKAYFGELAQKSVAARARKRKAASGG
ncbi:hypothetical protein [Amycolatopsis sp. cmx-4-54]|uniref:hypothetical protein n=1 Tax=Amycolatopsis sp. cmx-4-54 TaxID=2790936 RepID=UPI00397E0B14